MAILVLTELRGEFPVVRVAVLNGCERRVPDGFEVESRGACGFGRLMGAVPRGVED